MCFGNGYFPILQLFPLIFRLAGIVVIKEDKKM